MPTETVRVEWLREQMFLLQDRAGFPLVMTQPMGVNGADLLSLSLIGCAAWDVIGILGKQHQHVTRFEVTAESERDVDPPWRFRKIRIVYHVTGVGVSEAAVQRAIELTQEKYCSTYATLRAAIELISSYEIREG